ncbi:MAG TPA: BatD family protein [Flavobacteriaceae bacterium]|nr:BatD family protein [Flavobacteriaceae bacterium]
MKMKKLGFLILFVLIGIGAIAQVQFEAKVSKQRLGINERLRIDFEMNQDGDNFRPPSFENFRIVGGPNQSVSNTWINGKRSFAKTYSYFLSPQSRGKLIIGQATIEINGETYKTSPIEVEVTAAVETPKDGNNVDYVASENVHLVAEVSNSNPYLNEAITVTYKLYVSHDVSITSQWREIDSPKYSDFWSQNIDNNNFQVMEGKYNGRDYRYVILRTTVLYPQKTGKLEIMPLTLDVPIDVQGNRRDFFGRRIMERVNKTISAGKRTIDVKPLPEKGKPEDFAGAVGDFSFEVNANKQKLNTNESLQLDLKVSGKGNLKLFSLPHVQLPSSLEVYEPEYNEKVTTNAQGMQGFISNSYTIVPQYKGKYPIKPIRFSYFNPKTERYETITSSEINIEVEGNAVASTSGAGTPKQQVVLSEDDFKYIKLEGNLHSLEKKQFFQSGLFWSLIAAPVLLIPIVILAGRKRKLRLADVEGNRLREANRLAKKYLSEAKKNTGNTDAFYEALERALHNYLKAKLQIETSEMEKSHISSLLLQNKVSPSTVDEFMGLLKSCELARYASASRSAVDVDYEKAVKVISEIDKQMQL